MVGCAAVGCLNRSTKKLAGITFHRFPANPIMRENWIKAVRRENWVPSKNTFLCSSHFEEQYVDRTSLNCVRLRDNARPTVFPSFPKHLQKILIMSWIKRRGQATTPNPPSVPPVQMYNPNQHSSLQKVYKKKRLKEDAVPSVLQFHEITHQWLPLSKTCSSENVELLIIPEVGASRPGMFPCSDPLALEDVVAPLNAVKQQQISQQGNEVLDFFTALHTGKLRANIPNSSWGFHIQNKPVKYIMFSQSVEISNDFDAPHITKKVVIYESCEVKVWLLDKKIDIKDFSQKLNFVGDLERLLVTVNEMIICEGGPSVNCYSNVRVRCCDKDNISKKWRHRCCSVYLEKDFIKCFKCASLENILRKHHNTIQHRQKHHAILPPITKKSKLVKKKAGYKQSRMLKRSLIRLQELQDEVNGLKQKFTDVKLEVVEEILKDSNMPENQIMSEPHIKIEKFDESIDYYSSSNCDWRNECGRTNECGQY